MLSFTKLTAVIALAATLVAAAPAPASADGLIKRDVLSAIDEAEALGIDIRGPIPDDYSGKDDGVYTFDADSKASAWARAQLALADHPDVEKRQWANIGIGMWAQDWCNGQGVWADNVQYGYNNVATVNMYSVGISYRGLRNNEHLDFSRLKGSDWCGTYTYSAAANTPTGCFNSQLINCFRLWI